MTLTAARLAPEALLLSSLRAERRNLQEQDLKVGDCFVAELLAMTRREPSASR
jgi:hypothetical protein